jgi:hypothetical protein
MQYGLMKAPRGSAGKTLKQRESDEPHPGTEKQSSMYNTQGVGAWIARHRNENLMRCRECTYTI